MKDVGSGITLSVPLEESVHPSGAVTLENQLLAVPLVRSISWNVSVRSGVKLSKVICAVPSSATEPIKINWSNSLEFAPATSNVVVDEADITTSSNVTTPGLLPMLRLPNRVAPEIVPEPETSP